MSQFVPAATSREAGQPPAAQPPAAQSPAASREADAFVTASAVSRDGRHVAFATAEGIVHLCDRLHPDGAHAPGAWQRIEAHDGSVLSLCADTGPDGFLSGGDDNRLCRIVPDGTRTAAIELARGRRWVEQVQSVRDGRTGLIASSHGRQVELRDAGGALLRQYEHDSTVTGLAFDARGKRLASAHYGGASVRFVQAKADAPRLLAWKGSHIGIAFHPAGEAVVTAMQENELHGWRLADDHNMRMSGYPQKTRSLSFSRSGRWLATSGADAIVLWPFFGGGPMGKAPTELAEQPGVTCQRVAFHPQHDLVAAGYADGSVLLSDPGSRQVVPLAAPHGSPISTLAFTPDGTGLAFSAESGRMTVIAFKETVSVSQ